MSKLLFLFYFLLPLSSKANLDISKNGTCYSSFVTINNHSDSQNILKPVKPRTFIESLQHSKSWTLGQKQKILELLPQFNPDQLSSLFETILKFEIHHQEGLFDPSFTKTLMSITKEHIPQLDKAQLILTLYFYKEIGLKPDEAFIHLWRESALKKQREFESVERYFIKSFFVEQGIPSLKNPYDLKSGHAEHRLN